MPAELLPEALAVARSIQDESRRAEAFRGLLVLLNKTPMDLTFWCELLHTLAYLSRQELIEAMPKLSPRILALGGKFALDGTVVAMREVSQQWR